MSQQAHLPHKSQWPRLAAGPVVLAVAAGV
jgi:hypothetical protein